MTGILIEQPDFVADVPSACKDEPNAQGAPPKTRSVLHLINGEHYSGAERVQDLLAAGLPAAGFEVSFVALKPGAFGHCRAEQRAPLHEFPMQRRCDVRVVRRIARLVRNDGHCLIHAHTPRSLLVGRLVSLRTRRPLVYHVHSPAVRDSTLPWRNRMNQWIERLCLLAGGHVITVSSSLARHMNTQGIRASRISIVPNGVPAPTVRRDSTPPKPPWRVAMVALFRPRKGLEVLLEALSQVRSKGHDAKLLAIGPFEDDEYEREIKRQADRLQLSSAIEWTGFCDDVPGYLANSDLLALPSLFGEGLPMVVLESLAAGVPVVATRVEGVPEAVDDGVQGLLANPGDAHDLARCLETIMGGRVPWTQLHANAQSHHATRFSDAIMVRRVASVYRHVLARVASS